MSAHGIDAQDLASWQSEPEDGVAEWVLDHNAVKVEGRAPLIGIDWDCVQKLRSAVSSAHRLSYYLRRLWVLIYPRRHLQTGADLGHGGYVGPQTGRDSCFAKH